MKVELLADCYGPTLVGKKGAIVDVPESALVGAEGLARKAKEEAPAAAKKAKKK